MPATSTAVENPGTTTRATTTVRIDVDLTGDHETERDGDTRSGGGSSVAGIIIPIAVVLLAALGAAGWAYMNGLI